MTRWLTARSYAASVMPGILEIAARHEVTIYDPQAVTGRG